MKKRLLSFLLVLAMLLGLVSMTALASNEDQLLFRWLSWDNDLAYEEPTQPLMSFNMLSLSPGSGTVAYFYYGTTENCALIEEMTVVSGDSVSVHKFTDRDGKAYWRLQGEKSGDTVINIDGNNSITLSVKLPKDGLYTVRNQNEANFVNSGNGVSYYQLAEKALWLMCAEGYTAEELDAFTVTVNNQTAVTERILREGSSDRYDLKIQLVAPTYSEYYSNYQVNVRHPQRGNIASCSVNNQIRGNYATVGNYVVGFVWGSSNESEIIDMIRPDQSGYFQATAFLPSESNPYVSNADYNFMIMAGEAKTDAQGATYYESVSKDQLSFQVKRTWFQVINGEGTALSWTKGAPDSVEKNDYPAGTTKLTIYNKEGYLLKALVFAELEITEGKQVHTATISVPYQVTRAHVDLSVTRPADDTVEKLNAFLAELTTQDLSGVNGIDIYLAATTYEGVIELPSQWLGIRFRGGHCTTIKGGISLNGAYLPQCEGIHFIAPESDEITRAIWGGPSYLRNCTFYGYDIALDSTAHGLVSPAYGNVFVNNKIAVRVDVEGYSSTKWDPNWKNNTFLCNDTAIQILSLDQHISSYYLRIHNSNFVGNTTDFDIHAPGTFYWQKNYFAKLHPQGEKMTMTELLTALLEFTSEKDLHKVVTSNSPNLEKAKGMKIKVSTNPRWKYFVTEAFPLTCGNVGHITGEVTEACNPGFRYPYANLPVSDWGDTVTQIINDEADDLVMDASAFDAEGDKSVTVVDGEAENVLGTWTFE